MTTTDLLLLDALADCLESGDGLREALERVATAGGVAGDWSRQLLRSWRTDTSIAVVLRDSGVLDDDELALLSAAGAGAGRALHAAVLRRRRCLDRRRAIRRGLVAPFALAALAIVIDPLPNVVTGGAYIGPMLRGLLALVVLTLAVVAGIPALLHHPRSRAGALRLCAALPGVRLLAALYAEEELTTAVAPFVDGERVRTEGLAAAASLLAWSPLHEALCAAARSEDAPSAPLLMGGMEALASKLSLATDLAVVAGVASKRLADRLARRGEAIAVILTARLRLVTRVGAYAIVVALSASSLAGMVSRGLPGMPALPGSSTSPDQKEIEDLIKQLER